MTDNSKKNLIRSKQKYGVISQNIMRNPYITATAKSLYAYLAGFAGSDNSAFPSRELVCYEMNLNKDTFSKYLWELQCWKIITIEKNRGAKGVFDNNLYILDHYPELVMLEREDFTDTIWNELHELIESKSLKKKKKLNNNVQMSASLPCPEISDTVKKNSPCPDLPDTVQPDPAIPCPVNPDTNNNILNNNNLKNNNINKTHNLDSSQNSDFDSEVVVNNSSLKYIKNESSHGDMNSHANSKQIREKFKLCGMPNISKNVLEILQQYSYDEISRIAVTLQNKKNQGKIKNPMGLLSSHPETIIAILNNNFYPDVKKTPDGTKANTRDFQIYISQEELERIGEN